MQKLIVIKISDVAGVEESIFAWWFNDFVGIPIMALKYSINLI
jgi:hypothetical protein